MSRLAALFGSEYAGTQNRASKATATHDLQDLAEKGIFVPTGGSRSTYYEIKL